MRGSPEMPRLVATLIPYNYFEYILEIKNEYADDPRVFGLAFRVDDLQA